MNYTFPRLVWHLIYEYSHYVERCNIRLTCKWLAIFKNNNKLGYWVRRGDPVTLNLGGALLYKKLLYGVTVDFDPYSMSWAGIKLVYIGGNFENFSKLYSFNESGEGIKFNYYLPGVGTAYKNIGKQFSNNEHDKIIKFIIKNKIPQSWELDYHENNKYNFYIGLRPIIIHDFGRFHRFLLKHGSLTDLEYIKMIGNEVRDKLMVNSNKLAAAIFHGDFSKAIKYSNRATDHDLIEIGFVKACAHNRVKIASYLFKKINRLDLSLFSYVSLTKILRLESDKLILKCLIRIGSVAFLGMFRAIVNGGYIWAIKKILRILYS